MAKRRRKGFVSAEQRKAVFAVLKKAGQFAAAGAVAGAAINPVLRRGGIQKLTKAGQQLHRKLGKGDFNFNRNTKAVRSLRSARKMFKGAVAETSMGNILRGAAGGGFLGGFAESQNQIRKAAKKRGYNPDMSQEELVDLAKSKLEEMAFGPKPKPKPKARPRRKTKKRR